MDRDDMWQMKLDAERGVRKHYAHVIKQLAHWQGISPNNFLLTEDRDDSV